MSNSDITRVSLELISKGGGIISPELVNYLNRDFDPNNRDVDLDTEIFNSALKGFFYLGADGYAFSDIKSVFNFFNMTFDEIYPEATSPFIKFATSYWTLQFLVRPHPTKLEQRPRRTVSWKWLCSIEINIAGLFFPTPGRHKINPTLREMDQRKVIEASGAPIDIEEFIENNPILIRDRMMLKRSRIKKILWLLIIGSIAIFIIIKMVKLGILHFSVNTLTKNIDSLTRYISKNSLA